MRLARALLVAALLALPALAAGCFGPNASPVDVASFLPLHDAQPGRATEFALVLRSTSGFRQTLDVRAEGLPAGWSFAPENASVDLLGGKASTLVVRITPAPDAAYGPHAVDVLVGDTRASVVVNVRDLGREPLRAGLGAQVTYVLFADNGTVLATNEPAVKDQPGMRFAAHDNATPDYTPLKVFVGGTRGEAPPEPYNSRGCAAPPCYRAIEPALDARLRDAGDGRGMVAGDTLVVRMGQDRNALLRVVSVDDLA